jgi:hypothetical protein
MAWTWFFKRVRCFTRWVRRITTRRSIRVRSSATHVSGRKSTASSWARMRASTLSVFTFASAMARVLRGFDTITRRTSGRSIVAMASEFVVASRATSSSGRSVAAHCPQILWSHPDPAVIATDAVLDDGDLGERPVHVHADRPNLILLSVGRGTAGRNDTNGSALAAQSGQSQGRPSTNTSSQLTM